ncbi:hypothetical protein LTR56_001081 [Elasticomyces elasticus]|nr:hypothetical protein LTR56_001081 [Elasticomyces elasticus]KAK3663482.1 hypothetical protein LTR22_005653 [Elasticomyces elasticus]KAK4927133.1 hypothetical protein LTR49_006049 [Elasticomyces elasticus]KAK5769003.1 hypothetical protein LTS12_000716 [Elasticomyces elasticus]
MAPIVISDADDATPAVGKLFDGLAFFLVQQLPTRASYIAKVQANGGRVVKLEKQADYIIADHFKLGCPPGSFSYTFIDAAIKAGALPDPEDHPAGPPLGALREVGSVGVPGKQTRTPFTAADDKELWEYVEKARSDGGMVKGNDIYKHLEKKNPRHTYQAWRDRYIKKLMDRPPAGCKVKEEEIGPVFTEQDYKNLVDNAEDIRQLDPNSEVAAWQAWADAFPEHTGPEWMKYWKETVYPAYRKTGEYKKLRRAEKLERERVERGAEGKEGGDEVLPERANGQDVVAGPSMSSRNTTARSLERTEKGAGRQEPEAQPKPSGSRQPARSQQDDGETSKKRGAVPEPSAEPSAKRRATTPVKDEPLSQTTKTHKSRPSASQGSSSQRRVSQYGRLKEEYSDLFVTEEEANKPIMPSKPQPPKRAVNPDAPIEILSTDEERRRGKTAKTKRKPRKGRQEVRAEASRHETAGVEDVSALLMDGAGDDSAARNGDAMQLDRQPDLPTSELNRAAESQLRRESVHEAEEDDDGQQVFDDYVTNDEELPLQPVVGGHARLPHMATATSTSPLMRAIEQPDKDLDSFLPTSEANREADRQVRRESGNGTGLAVEQLPVHGRYFDLPTSDANHAAEKQARRESGHITSDSAMREQYSEITTSDANHAAEDQVRRESVEHIHIRDDLEQAIEDFTVMNDAEEVDEEEFGDYLLEHNGTAVNVQGEAADVREGGEEPSLLTMLENVLATDIDDFERNVQALDEETRVEPSQRAQVRSEVLELGGSTPEDIEDGEDETMDVTISTHLVEDGEVEDGLPGEEFLDGDEDAEVEDDLPEEEPINHEEGGEEDEGLTEEAVLNAEDETVLPFVDIDDESDEANDVTITNGFMGHDEDERGSRMSDDADVSDGGGHALTAENLASQQAEHRPPVVRGVDLPEDDAAQDQGEFLSALQALMAQTKQAKKPATSHSTEQAVKHGLDEPAQQQPGLEAQLVRTAGPVPEAPAHKQQSDIVRREATVSKAHEPAISPQQDDLLDQTTYTHNETDLVSNASHPRDTNGFMDLPITSDEDINDILESSLRWPYSPQQSKRQVAAVQQDESMQFETQITYPKLRYQEESDVVFGEDEPERKVLYPSLPVEVAKPAAEEEEEEEDMQSQLGVEPDMQPEEDNAQSQLGVDLEMQPEPQNEDLQSQLGFETQLATESDGGFVVVDRSEGFHEQDAAQNVDEDEEEDDLEQEYEIDFDVPEPEGGFGFSSSPARAAEAQTVESRQSSPGVDTRHQNDLTHDQERSLYEENDGFEGRQPEASLDVTSSPFRPSPRRPNLQSTRLASRAGSLIDHEEGDDGIVVDVDAQGDTIEISSAEPPSSPYQSSRAPSSQAGEEPAASRRQLATQDILDAETQLPDLSMPLPPDSEDEISDADDETSAAASASRVPHHEAQPSLVEASEDDSQELPAPSAKRPERAAAQSLPTPPLQPLRPFKKLAARPPQVPLVSPINLAETQSLEEGDVEEYIMATKLRYNFSAEAIMHALKATSIRPDLAEIVLFDQRAGRKFPTDVPGIWTPEEDAIIEGGNARLIRQVQARHGSEECDKRLTWLEWYRAGG